MALEDVTSGSINLCRRARSAVYAASRFVAVAIGIESRSRDLMAWLAARPLVSQGALSGSWEYSPSCAAVSHGRAVLRSPRQPPGAAREERSTSTCVFAGLADGCASSSGSDDAAEGRTKSSPRETSPPHFWAHANVHAERGLIDATGKSWTVRELDTRAVPGARAARCLVLENHEVVRRFWSFRHDWTTIPDRTLLELLGLPR